MFQKIILLSSLAILLAGCQTETSVKEPNVSQVPSTSDNSNKRIHETAVDENDLMGRMAFGIRTLQEEYDRSSASMPSLGKVTVSVDERGNFTIRNEVNGEIRETKVNLRDLDSEQGGFRLLADGEVTEYPGLLVQTVRNAQKVEHLVDGKIRQKNSELQIFMVDRPAIERITPALLQTVRLAKTIQ